MRRKCFVVYVIICLFSLPNPPCFARDKEPSRFEDSQNEVCAENDGNCEGDRSNVVETWQPFQISGKSKWISFDKLAESYAAWHQQALFNENISCKEKKTLAFTPNAGLGDSVGALTSAFTYAMRTGRLFFIDWQPFAWSLAFQDLPFFYDYSKALGAKTKSNEPLICPSEDDATSFISGHITTQHPLVEEARTVNFNTDYSNMMEYFLRPSDDVQSIIQKISDSFRNQDEKNVLLHKVAIVMRTGIGEYNQFLSAGDEENFVTCFRNYAKKFQEKQKKNGKQLKFVVFVTSDNAESKQVVVDSLRKHRGNEFDVNVVTIEDSTIHLMHMTAEDSQKAKVREKLWKTIAEFFLIGQCDVKFLTHGSLFGRVAVERGGGPEENNFFLSDSNCDGKRQKYSYLECHDPKYPPICELS